MLKLKQVLAENGLKQSHLAHALGLSVSALNLLINYNQWPKKANKPKLKDSITNWLTSQGVTIENDVFSYVTEGGHPQPHFKNSPNLENEDDYMVLRKQTPTQEAIELYNLVNDPFKEPQCYEDLYLSKSTRFVRERLYNATKQADFLALIGESGSGKTTLITDLKARIIKEQQPVIIIEPYVLGMEDNDLKGKTLKMSQIVEAIMRKIAPSVHLPRSMERRFNILHEHAEEAVKNGTNLVLLIEEAHSLPLATLKHLKRLYELKTGYTKLFSIILVGQQELDSRLSTRDQEVREVVSRCTVFELKTITDIKEYLDTLFKRANLNINNILTKEAIEALKEKLTIEKYGQTISRMHPLLVNNTIIAAMNYAANVYQSPINADTVKKV